jgi:hypothetical protein
VFSRNSYQNKFWLLPVANYYALWWVWIANFCALWTVSIADLENVQRNTESRSCNYCCSGKNYNYYIFWVCVCSLRYPACNAHAQWCYLWPVRLYNIFPHYFITGRFSKKKLTEHKIVFWYSVRFCLKSFSFQEELRKVWPTMCTGIHIKYPLFLSDVNVTYIF